VTTGTLITYGSSDIGGAISINANASVSTGSIFTYGLSGGGAVTINSTNGAVATGAILTTACDESQGIAGS
jgi:hypothetical protein